MDLNRVSGETLENADHIYNGTGEQERAVEGLKQIMERLTEELNSSVKMSANVSAETGETTEKDIADPVPYAVVERLHAEDQRYVDGD